ncbi:MAG: rhomboid family intramembrane serine protease GlpG, partial [Candidatus Schmidhempelia sp.]|nr:rhomboid family intramembrane serine protease GlpG [Candidatus Schmidhempelia sp.]
MYLISIANISAAYVFADYMATKGIIIRIEINNKKAELYLDNPDYFSLVQQEFQQFINQPNHHRYAEASWKKGQIINTNIMPIKAFNLIKAGPCTLIITVVCLIMFIAKNIFGVQILLAYFGFPINSYAYGDLWRWFTPIFLHFSLLHLIFNLSWWWYLGSMIEKQYSSLKLLEIIIITSLISNYSEALFSNPYFGGLSGVVYALMGYVWFIGRFKPTKGIYLDNAVMIIAIIWLFAGLTGYLGSIANVAHIMGLLVGLGLAIKDVF